MNLRSRRLNPLIINSSELSEQKQENNIINLIPLSNNFYNPISELEMEQEGKNGDQIPNLGGTNLIAALTSAFAAAHPIGVMPSFNGGSNDVLPEDYIAKWNRYAKTNSLTEAKKLDLAGMNLKGVAESWYNDLPEDGPAKNDWCRFGEALIRRFTVPGADMNYFRNFQLRKQKKNETVEDFGEDLKKLAKFIRNKNLVVEPILVTTFINGLLPHVRRAMEYQGSIPETLMEAVLSAKRIESANAIYFESTKSTDGSNSGRSDNNKKRSGSEPTVITPIVPVLAQVVKPTGGNEGQTQKPFVCLRCNQPGHLARNCPTIKDVTCFKCQQQGHYANKCPNEKVFGGTVVKAEQKDPVRVIASNERKLPGVFVIQNGDFKATAHINDVRTTVVMDSGASRHCMSAGFYDRMDKHKHPLIAADVIMSNADGESMHVLGSVKLNIEFDNCIGKSEIWNFYVIENLVDNVLVGRDDIDAVTLKNGMVVKKQTNLVRMVEAVTVPAQSTRMVKTVSDVISKAEQILEPASRRCGQLARCLVNHGTQHHITNVINTGVDPIHLHAEEVVGQIEDAVVVPTAVDVDVDVDVVKEAAPVIVEPIQAAGETLTVRVSNEPSTNDLVRVVTVNTALTDDDIMKQMDSRLVEEQREKLKSLLYRYRHVFSSNPKGPGMVTHVEHSIDTGTSVPIKQRSYRVSKKEEEYINHEIDEMIHNDIIRPSSSPWSSPVVLVMKKDGTLRFCIDYRKLNDVTKKDSYPLPRIQEALDVLNGAKYFSSLDFASGYWQIKVRDEDVAKTAFVTKRGLFEFTRMPFGLANAPATFQRAMDILLSGLNWKVSLIYIDDILVFSSTFDEHLIHLESVLQRLSDAKFTVKLSKCFFGREEVAYLGHVVSSQGVKPDPSKLKAVEQFPIPTNLTEVRSFLGLTTYYHRFVPSYSTVAAPLYRLQKKNVHFEWSNECQVAFEGIKQLLISSPTLRFPNFNKEFIIMADASGVGVGVILSQIDDDAKEYVVGYASRSLSAEERNYSTTEKECLAVLFGIKFFRPYLHGNHFTVITDHGSLTWLMNLRDANGRLARWALQLQGLDYKIKHRPGREHANADALSRCPIRMITDFIPIRIAKTRAKQRIEQHKSDQVVSSSSGEEIPIVPIVNELLNTNINTNVIQVDSQSDTDVIIIDPIIETDIKSNVNVQVEPSMNDFQIAQLEDVDYVAVITYLKTKQLPNDNKEASRIRVWSSSFMITDDLLYYVWTPTNAAQRLDVRKLLVVPSKLRQEIMIHYHDSYAGGHFGSYKTFMKIRDRYWWPTMFQDVELYCKSCLICQRRKIPRRQRETALMGTPVANHPFERIGVDVVGPLPETLSGNKYIVVFTDSFTRWTEAFAVVEQKEETIAQLLVEEIVCRFGAPKYLLSDRGANFLSALCMKVYELLHINKVTTTSYHPQANGIVERFNGVLVETLAMFSGESDWDAYIPYALSAYRSSFNVTIQETPYYMVFGRQMTLPIDSMLNVGQAYHTDHSDYADEMSYRLNESHNRVKLHLQKIVDEREKKNNNMHHAKEFHVGDLVWLRAVTPAGTNNKLNENQWKGPYKILERLSLVNYKLDIPISSSGKAVHNVVHVDRLKLYFNPETTSAAAASRDRRQ